MELKGIVESLIFASNKPLTLQQLRSLTNTPLRQLKAVVEELQANYEASGIQIAEVGGGYQFRTNPDAANWVKKLLAGRPQRLTRPMLETLAIIAYQQPITRPEIEEIRGVDCGNTLRVLLERNLLRILGKKEEVGRPILYGTTKFFLEFFQLPSLKDLPTLKEFTELSPEHEEQVEFYFGNRGEADADDSNAEPLEGPPEPPHLRVVSSAPGGPEAEGEDSAEEAVSPPVVAVSEAETVADSADAPTAAAADASTATPPPPPLQEEEEDAVLDSLDRAIARAGSVLREINPRPKRSRAAASDADTEDTPAAPSAAESTPPVENQPEMQSTETPSDATTP